MAKSDNGMDWVGLALTVLAAGCFAGRADTLGEPDEPAADASTADASGDGGTDDAEVDAAPDGMHRGTRGDPSPPPCVDPDAHESRAERVRATTVGATESRTDRCDDDGNLIDHRCEILPSTDCAPCQGECSGCVEHTGRVIEVPFDCNGGCVDGACANWCPDQGDELSISVDGTAQALRVENLTKPGTLVCVPHVDGSTEPHCSTLEGYVPSQVYESFTDCYGDEPSTLRLHWSLAGSAVDGPAMCFVTCTKLAEL